MNDMKLNTWGQKIHYLVNFSLGTQESVFYDFKKKSFFSIIFCCWIKAKAPGNMWLRHKLCYLWSIKYLH